LARGSTKLVLVLRMIDSGAAEDKGRRDYMEDYHILLEKVEKASPSTVSFYGIYDGHGGEESAQIVQKKLHYSIFNNGKWKEKNFEEAITEGFMSTDRIVIQRTNHRLDSSGSTAVIALIVDHTLYIANVGDSEAIIAIKEGQSSDLRTQIVTNLHRASNIDEKKRVLQLGGNFLFGRLGGTLSVTRAFGDFEFKEPKSKANFVTSKPFINKIELTPAHKFLVLASDGLWDVFDKEDVTKFVVTAHSNGLNAKQIAQMLVEEAIKKGSMDNVSAIITIFNGNFQPIAQVDSTCQIV